MPVSSTYSDMQSNDMQEHVLDFDNDEDRKWPQIRTLNQHRTEASAWRGTLRS